MRAAGGGRGTGRTRRLREDGREQPGPHTLLSDPHVLISWRQARHGLGSTPGLFYVLPQGESTRAFSC